MLAAKYRGLSEGDTGYAASEEASPGIHGLQVVPTTTNSGTDAKVFAAHRANSFTPADREKTVIFSLPVHDESCEFPHGDGGCEGVRERAVSVMVYVF